MLYCEIWTIFKYFLFCLILFYCIAVVFSNDKSYIWIYIFIDFNFMLTYSLYHNTFWFRERYFCKIKMHPVRPFSCSWEESRFVAEEGQGTEGSAGKRRAGMMLASILWFLSPSLFRLCFWADKQKMRDAKAFVCRTIVDDR